MVKKVDKRMSTFSHNELTLRDLVSMNFVINQKWNQPKIKGLYLKKLTTFTDDRGDLTEIWSKPWSKNEPVAARVEHAYFNTTHEGIIKGWHVHKKTHSQYTCVKGKMQVVLVDVRKDSPTFCQVDKFVIGSENPSYIKIPPGVLKAWKSLKGDSIIVNLLTTADVNDNYKYPPECILKDVWK